MDPLTLKVLATLVQVNGTATVVSTNKGIDDLLGPVREKLHNEKFKVAEDGDLFNCKLTHCKDLYTKQIQYYKYVGKQSQQPTRTSPTAPASKSPGNKRR